MGLFDGLEVRSTFSMDWKSVLQLWSVSSILSVALGKNPAFAFKVPDKSDGRGEHRQ